MSDENKPESNEASGEVAAPQRDATVPDDKSPKEEKHEFGSLTGKEEVAALNNEKMELVLEIPVTISVEIGRTKISIKNLLQLNQGSIIELDRLAGEPLDVFVNGTMVAHGEVVVVNDKFGVRLTDVISKTERIKQLG